MAAVTLVKVSKKGQFPIPAEIREGMGITPSENFVAYAGVEVIKVTDGLAVLEKKPVRQREIVDLRHLIHRLRREKY